MNVQPQLEVLESAAREDHEQQQTQQREQAEDEASG
jgi:hypothetical protein